LRPRGWFENITLSRVYPHLRTVVALHIDDTGTVRAATYHLEDRQVLEVGTELSDGRWLLTSNGDLQLWYPPPAVRVQLLSREAPLATILSTHRQWLQATLQEGPAPQAVSVSTLEVSLLAARRFSRIEGEYRRSWGLLRRRYGERHHRSRPKLPAFWRRSLVVTLFAVCASPLSGGCPGIDDLNEEVRRTEAAFAKTMADRDFGACTSFLADDTAFFSRQGIRRGKSNVAATWRPFYEGPARPSPGSPRTSKFSTLATSP
jgi:hypothetical protein